MHKKMDKDKKKMPEKPRHNPIAQAGNYAAEVDTAGMDPSMKPTLGVDKPRKKKSLMDLIRRR